MDCRGSEEQCPKELEQLRKQNAELRSAIAGLERDAVGEQLHFLQVLIDTIPVPIYYKDLQGVYQGCNNAYLAMLGLSKEDLIGKTSYDIYPKEQAYECLMTDEDLVDNPGMQVYNRKLRFADDMDHDVILHKATYEDSACRPAGLVGVIIDVTEHKQAEEALRKNETQLRRITDNMLDMVMQTDMCGIVQYASPSHESILGYEPEELVGKPVLDFIHPDDLGRVIAASQMAISTASSGKVEYRFHHADGHHVWLETVGKFLPDDRGMITGAIFGGRDITERKRMENELEKHLDQFEEMVEARTAELRDTNLQLQQEIEERCRLEENRDRLADIVEMTPDFVGIACPDQRVQYLNGAARNMLGIGEFEEISQMRVCDTYPASVYQNVIKAAIQTAIRDGIWSGETTLLSCTGREIPVLGVIIAHKEPCGAVFYLSTIARDMSERKRAEERQHLASVVFENVSSGLMVIASDGIIQSVNPAFTSITGFDPEDVTGKGMYWYFCEHYSADTSDMMRSLMATGRYRDEAWTNRKNGQKYFEGFTVTAIRNDQGEITHYINIFQDITEEEEIRKERRSLREQKARMQRLASLSTLSAGIVHEIGQPLNTIKLLADTMLYLYDKKDIFNIDVFIDNLKKISGQADQINLLVNQMRSFANARQISEDIPCNLNDAIKKIMTLLGRQLSTHGIEVRTELEENLPEILGTANAYEEVVLNLLANAMHALDTVSKQEKEIIIKTYLADAQVMMEVSDNGTGISEEIMSNIFEPLFTTKKTGEGMGLGLSIVQSFLERFDGRIEVHNNSRGGATFNLKFPPTMHSTKG